MPSFHRRRPLRDSGHIQGQLRNPDYPDQILEIAAADKIRNYRVPYQRNRQVDFLQACCLPRDASMASSCVCFSSSPTSRQTTTLRSLDIRRTKRSFATAAVSSFTATGAPLGWHVLKLWRCVAPPPPRDAMLLSLAGEQGAGEARGGGSPTCRPATGSLTAFVGLIVTHPPR